VFVAFDSLQLGSDDQDEDQFDHHERDSGPEVPVLISNWRLRRKESYIDELEQEYCHDCEWGHTLFDNANAFELRIVNKTEIVFVDIVLEDKEDACNHCHIRHDRREEKHDCEGGQRVRTMVAQVIRVGVHERLLGDLVTLVEVVVGLADALDGLVRQIEQPEANREES